MTVKTVAVTFGEQDKTKAWARTHKRVVLLKITGTTPPIFLIMECPTWENVIDRHDPDGCPEMSMIRYLYEEKEGLSSIIGARFGSVFEVVRAGRDHLSDSVEVIRAIDEHELAEFEDPEDWHKIFPEAYA